MDVSEGWTIFELYEDLYLASPSNNELSETLLSKAGGVYEEIRNRLIPKNAEKFVLVHHNHNLPLIA